MVIVVRRGIDALFLSCCVWMFEWRRIVTYRILVRMRLECRAVETDHAPTRDVCIWIETLHASEAHLVDL